MSKAVMISIRPGWCEKIASGEKTIEVRKTRPKLQTPFKCYIYCTVEMAGYDALWVLDTPTREKYSVMAVSAYLENPEGANKGNGKVIGEFTCDRIYELAPLNHAPDDVEQQACLTREEIVRYIKGVGYGWHISGLKIYDTPLELGEFWAYNEVLHKRYDAETDFCCYDSTNEYGEALTDCGDAYIDIRNCYRCWNEWSGWCHRVNRPPQSWCYVEEQK